jgi:hypothetical protein
VTAPTAKPPPATPLGRSDSLGYLDPGTSSSATAIKQSATFTVVPGLADGSCYSFRDSSGHRYLCRKDFRIRFDASNGTAFFDKDATSRADSPFRAVGPWA